MKSTGYVLFSILMVFLIGCSEKKESVIQPEEENAKSVEIFKDISEYQKLPNIEEAPLVNLPVELPGIKTYANSGKSIGREIKSTECVYHYFGERDDYISEDKGVTFSPAILSRNYYAYQWQPVTITFPQTADSVIATCWGSTYMIAYNESGSLLGYSIGGGEWESVSVKARGNKKIKSVVMHSYFGDNCNWFVWNMTVCYTFNDAPIADAGEDQTFEHNSNMQVFTLDASGSSDPEGEELSYSWVLNEEEISTEQSPTLDLPVGIYTFTLTVTDPQGLSGSDDVVISITDTVPPELNFKLLTTSLWPVNHKMVLVASGINAFDSSCETDVNITVTSSEPGNADGDGNTEEDWQIIENPDGTFDIYLRAERAGNGDGRIYTISVNAEDCSGNISTQSAVVTVPESNNNNDADKGDDKEYDKGKDKGKDKNIGNDKDKGNNKGKGKG